MSSPSRFAKSAARPLLFLLLLCLPTARAEQVKNLKPQGYVNDFAGVLSAQAKDKLTALCAEVDQGAKAVVTRRHDPRRAERPQVLDRSRLRPRADLARWQSWRLWSRSCAVSAAKR